MEKDLSLSPISHKNQDITPGDFLNVDEDDG